MPIGCRPRYEPLTFAKSNSMLASVDRHRPLCTEGVCGELQVLVVRAVGGQREFDHSVSLMTRRNGLTDIVFCMCARPQAGQGWTIELAPSLEVSSAAQGAKASHREPWHCSGNLERVETRKTKRYCANQSCLNC